MIPTYSKIASNRNIFLLYNRLGGSVHGGGDHYSAIVEPEASPQEITYIVMLSKIRMTLTAKQMMKENQKRVNQGVGVADLHANVSGVHNRFGDEFHCCDGDYLYDEFGDLCGVFQGYFT